MRVELGWIAMVMASAMMGGCGDEVVGAGEHSSKLSDAPIKRQTQERRIIDCGVATPDDTSECGPGREMVAGYRVDEQRGCLGEAAPVGCRVIPTDCDDGIAVVRNARGELFWFGNLCLPDGVEEVRDSPAANWDRC